MATKIHCDLLEIFGPDWADITPEQVECLVETIHTTNELLGKEPELYGFVGTQHVDSVVGGYFAIQYEENEFHYDKQKRLDIRYSAPFARILFVLFAATGKLLLQNAKFAGIPSLNMSKATRLFKNALNQALAKCEIREVIDFYLPPEITPQRDFVKEFERSTRVVRLEVTDPLADRIPDDFEYYNPLRERNPIIRDSHRHDYAHIRRVDLEATTDGDLKETHLRDLVEAATPETMRFYIGREEFVLHREVPRKFEFYINMEAEQLPKKQLIVVIDLLRRERAVFLDTPTSESPEPGARQLGFFDAFTEEDE
jgi:hypothetical protein